MATPVDAWPGTAAGGSPLAEQPARRWAWRAPIAILLALVLPALVLTQGPTPTLDLILVLQLALCAYTGTRLAAMVGAPTINPLQGMFWLFCYTAMGIAPLAQLVVGSSPVPMTGSLSDHVHGLLLVLVGCIAFDVGATLHSDKGLLKRQRSTPPKARGLVDIPRGRTAVFTVLAFAGAGLLVATLGVDTFFSSRQAVGDSFAAAGISDDTQATSATLRALGTVPILLAFLILTRRLVVAPENRRRPAFLFAWAATLGAQVVVNNPISNARFWFITVALSTVLILFPRGTNAFRTLLLLGVAASLVLFPFADRFRYVNADSNSRANRGVVETLATKDYDQMNMVVNTVTYVREAAGHTYGRQASGALLFWVPRSSWETKPIDTGTEVALYIGTVNTNLSEPLWAELWIDFGIAGMLLGFLLLGYLLRRGDRWYAGAVERGRRVTTVGMIAIPVIAGYEAILLRGSLLQAMGRLGVMVLCFILLSAWTRRRGAPAEPAPASTAPRREPQPVLG
jgi:hypothetical protein